MRNNERCMIFLQWRAPGNLLNWMPVVGIGCHINMLYYIAPLWIVDIRLGWIEFDCVVAIVINHRIMWNKSTGVVPVLYNLLLIPGCNNPGPTPVQKKPTLNDTKVGSVQQHGWLWNEYVRKIILLGVYLSWGTTEMTLIYPILLDEDTSSTVWNIYLFGITVLRRTSTRYMFP